MPNTNPLYLYVEAGRLSTQHINNIIMFTIVRGVCPTRENSQTHWRKGESEPCCRAVTIITGPSSTAPSLKRVERRDVDRVPHGWARGAQVRPCTSSSANRLRAPTAQGSLSQRVHDSLRRMARNNPHVEQPRQKSKCWARADPSCSQAPSEGIRQWVQRENRRLDRATSTTPGEPIERLFSTRTKTLQELRDLQKSQALRMSSPSPASTSASSLGRAAGVSAAGRSMESCSSGRRRDAPGTTAGREGEHRGCSHRSPVSLGTGQISLVGAGRVGSADASGDPGARDWRAPQARAAPGKGCRACHGNAGGEVHATPGAPQRSWMGLRGGAQSTADRELQGAWPPFAQHALMLPVFMLLGGFLLVPGRSHHRRCRPAQRAADRGIRYGDSMKQAVETARRTHAALDR